ncbi:MAG: hypothetical protein ABH840_04750 [Nanoarchaeota archaeon]
MRKKSQVGMEYMIIIGFVTFIVITTLGIALYYSSGIRDRIMVIQMSNCAKEIISSAESVFYQGNPSKATILCYLPENINQIEIIENSLVFTYQSDSGISRTSFSSKVPISGSLPAFSGTRKIKIFAEEGSASISLA